MKSRTTRGFTLVELMIVAVIVAILAAVAIPLMSANKTRAVATEAEAALGTIRSVLRGTYAQTDAYDVDISGAAVALGSATNLTGLVGEDLEGRYFSAECYAITAIGADHYTVTATGDDSTAAGAAEAAGVVITLDEDGNFTRALP